MTRRPGRATSGEGKNAKEGSRREEVDGQSVNENKAAVKWTVRSQVACSRRSSGSCVVVGTRETRRGAVYCME